MDELKKLIDEIFALQRSFQGRSDKNDAAIKQLQNKYEELVKQMVNLEVGGGHGSNNGHSRAYEGFNALLKDLKGDQAPQLNAREYAEYRNGVRDYLRYGQSALDKSDIRNTLSVGSDPHGGYWVVPERDMMPKEKLFMENPMRALAAVQNVLMGDAYQGLRDDDEFLSGWGHEAVERAETAAGTLIEYSNYLREVFALVPLTNKLIDMGAIDVLAYTEDRIFKRFRRAENTAFVAGGGLLEPRGFMDYRATATTQNDTDRPADKLQYVPTGQSAGFPTNSGIGGDDPSALIDLRQSLNSALRSGATWVMNSTSEGRLAKLKDAEGRWLFTQSLVPGIPNVLLGHPIAILEAMPDFGADSYPVAFGNFSDGYQIVDKPGIRVLRDPYTKKGTTKIFAYKYVGGDVVNFSAIKLLKASAA